MTTIINQEPTTREGLAFNFVKFACAVITDPGTGREDWSSGTGRSLTTDEQRVYKTALSVFEDFLRSDPLMWRSSASGNGLYMITHLGKASLEAVLVAGDRHIRLINASDQEIVLNSSVSGMWLGPLPMAPTIRSSYE